MTLKIYDPEWQDQYLDHEAKWNVAVLHGLGHPIPAAEWYELAALRDQGFSPESVLSDLTAKAA